MTDALTATENARDIALEHAQSVTRQRDAVLSALWSLYWNVTDRDGRRYLPDALLLSDIWKVLEDVDPSHVADVPVSDNAYRVIQQESPTHDCADGDGKGGWCW